MSQRYESLRKGEGGMGVMKSKISVLVISARDHDRMTTSLHQAKLKES